MTDFDLLCSTTLGDLVGTREFRGQDWLEEAQLLISMDSSIGDVLLTKNVEDQWQQKMVYYWRENAVQTHLPSQVQAQVDRDLVMHTERFGYVGKVRLVHLSRQSESRRNEV